MESKDKDKEYKGIWMVVGLLLSLVAVLGMIFLLGMGIYFLLKGY